MFHQFAVPDHQKTYLRFFWYENNDPNRPLIEWWSKVHLMGLKSSPAIANTGIRFAAREHPPRNGSEWIREDDLLDPIHPNATRTQDQIEKDLADGFYVDDLLTSKPTEKDALNLIQTGISRTERYDLKLCQVQSNSQMVRKAYPPKDPLPEVITLREEQIPNMPEEESSSLGLQWHVKQDAFSIKVVPKDREKTKAGALGHIGAVFDPLGIADPAKLVCRLLMREIIPRLGEDDPHGVRALGY